MAGPGTRPVDGALPITCRSSRIKSLSPTPTEFPNLITRVISMDLKSYDLGAAELKATRAPFFFIHGDADGVRLNHMAEMFRLKGDEIMGDMRPRSESWLAVLPNNTRHADGEGQYHHSDGDDFLGDTAR